MTITGAKGSCLTDKLHYGATAKKRTGAKAQGNKAVKPLNRYAFLSLHLTDNVPDGAPCALLNEYLPPAGDHFKCFSRIVPHRQHLDIFIVNKRKIGFEVLHQAIYLRSVIVQANVKTDGACLNKIDLDTACMKRIEDPSKAVAHNKGKIPGKDGNQNLVFFPDEHRDDLSQDCISLYYCTLIIRSHKRTHEKRYILVVQRFDGLGMNDLCP